MRNKWLIYIILIQFVGLIVALVSSSMYENFHAFIYYMMFNLTVTNSIAVFASILLLLFERQLKDKIRIRYLQTILVLIIIGISVYLSRLISAPLVNTICDVQIRHDVDKNHIYTIAVNLFIYFIIFSVYVMIIFYEKLRVDWERKVREIETLQRLNSEAKYAILQSKVNPHFLFNTLNSILDLVYKIPEKVEEIIINLSDIYRKVLNLPENIKVTLDDEIELVRKYLEIEKIRLGKRLEFEISIDPAARAFLIPPLTIITLVENAVIHGISKKKNGGRISVNAAKENESIVININDTGLGFDPKHFVPGFGLSSVSDRLKLYTNGKAILTINSSLKNGTTITIIMPYDL